ncbi:baculoviral IAP repeat-containing protein 6-like [Diaphorina citri]|uniref:Baculoviral IAP repeat-containing protein 6-like n=1 Tax=Diaphorina citri TaxID=121845 RepID=A0A3Q0JHA6_DIACI|nr:baculoviral IAP repeat-containing protein 6-like [Diaphorina citri]
MADGGVWKLQDDGYLNIDADPDSVIYHPNLNILIVLSRNAECIVVDINSGCVLRKCAFAEEGQPIKGAYLPSYDKVLLTDTKSVGVRSDYNGVLLLDTMLQTCLKSKNNPVKLEMLVSEAILLQQTLKTIETTGCEFSPGLWTEVLTELETKIEAAQSEPKKSAKSQKWNIICLELKHASFKTACYSLVCELKRQNRHVPALAIASAINERLNCLHPTPFPIDSQPSDHRNLMFSEAARRETFAKWPHMDYKWALPDQMAQAGFYHQPSGTGDDRAMCFTCIVCLVCWEPTDEPWAEHERHSPCCPFVKGEYTQNVPLSVTYATAPALAMTHALNPDSTLVDITTLPGYIPLISRDSTVLVLNYIRQLKVENEFSVSKLCYDYGLSHSELKVSAAAIAANVKHSSKASESLDEEHVNREETENVPRPCLIVGARMKTTGEDLYQLKQRLESGGNPLAMDTELTSSPPPPSPHLCLLVLDFHYRPNKSPATAGTQTSAPGNKKAVSGTGTSTATVGGGKLIQVVKLSASPVKSLTPATPGEGIRKAILLPQDQSSTVLAGLTTSGTLVLMDVLKLEVLSSLLPIEGQEFVTLTYCNSLERICVATSSGSLRFYALRDEDEFRLREEASGSPVMKKKSIAPSSTSSSSSTNSSDNLIVSRASYGLPELRALYSLTLFETLSPGYSAAVPPCWSELMQAQKQRRHAQHLTREDIHTRSWRLQNDLTTWDEHMFELSLPKNTCVGQVDVKLTLHTPCPQVPPLQVTLLRPMTSRAPFQASHSGSYTSTPVDAGVSFSLPSEEGAKGTPRVCQTVGGEKGPRPKSLTDGLKESEAFSVTHVQTVRQSESTPRVCQTVGGEKGPRPRSLTDGLKESEAFSVTRVHTVRQSEQ